MQSTYKKWLPENRKDKSNLQPSEVNHIVELGKTERVGCMLKGDVREHLMSFFDARDKLQAMNFKTNQLLKTFDLFLLSEQSENSFVLLGIDQPYIASNQTPRYINSHRAT